MSTLRIARERGIHYPNIIYIMGMHAMCVYSLFYLFEYNYRVILAEVFLMWQVSGIGITGGYHRLWSHRSYRANFFVRALLAFLGTVCHQGSIYHWSVDHRLHHKYSDTEHDPHNINNGFFYSHMGWLFVRKHPEFREIMKKYDYSDLLADPIVAFQHRYYFLLAHVCSFGLPALYGHYMHDSIFVGLFYHGVLRWLLSLHATWCVNSVSHTFGYRPYRPDIPPSDNLFTSVVAVGEGWHNYHHAYPSDYSASEHGFMSQWNPTTFFIDCMAALGFAWDLKKIKVAKHAD